MAIISLDLGTTNTKLRLINKIDKKVLYTHNSSIGIKDVAISGNKDILINGIINLVDLSLKESSLSLSDIDYITASGMVTSNLGLLEIDHILTPASFDDMVNSVVKTEFQWLNNIPFYLIPGMKNGGYVHSIDHIDKLDMMRGEEVETIGILELCNIKESCIIILPGSHTKFVYVGENGQIERCSTTLLGEMFSSLVKSTILSSSISENLITTIDEEYILHGMNLQRKTSTTKAAFTVRLMDVLLDTTENQRANFLAGALVSDDVNTAILSELSQDKFSKVYIGGSDPLKTVFKVVLENSGLDPSQIISIPDEITNIAPSTGSIMIVEEYRKKDNVL